MKKYFVLLTMLLLLSFDGYPTPEEFWKGRPCFTPKQSLLDDYVGSQKYRYLVGGLYQKGNTLGAVLYVDEERGTMMLYSVTQHHFIPQFGDESTYENIKAAYQRNGWHLFDKETAYFVCKNQHTMVYNRNWEDTDEHQLYIPYYLPLDYDEFKYDIYALSTVCSTYDEWAITRQTKLWFITNEEGTREAVHCHFAHAGWIEVPLEPQYVDGYITE